MGWCECGNEPSVYIKYGEFIDWLLNQKGAAWSDERTVWPCRSNWQGGQPAAASRHLHITAICEAQLVMPSVCLSTG